jgi:hypothetical protein
MVSGANLRLHSKGRSKVEKKKEGAKQMTHEAKITIKLNTNTEDVNFQLDFDPEFDAKTPDSNKAAIIALRMIQLIEKEGLIK